MKDILQYIIIIIITIRVTSNDAQELLLVMLGGHYGMQKKKNLGQSPTRQVSYILPSPMISLIYDMYSGITPGGIHLALSKIRLYSEGQKFPCCTIFQAPILY